VDQAYIAIRDRIDDGRLARGTRLHQEDLAAELGVSRTPVREALTRLAAEGRVELLTNRGARVADIDPAAMPEPYEARLVIEPGAAAQRGAAGDIQRSFAANRDFHLGLVEATGNKLLLQFAEHLWVARIGAAIYEQQAETAERMLLDAEEHEAILEAVERGDARKAESLARRHVADALRRLDAG
jgi:DNA-binding GntR family transcriptional regulator